MVSIVRKGFYVNTGNNQEGIAVNPGTAVYFFTGDR